MVNIPYSHVTLLGGFWKAKEDMVRSSTVTAVYNRFAETNRFDALRCKWLEEGRYEGHVFWDSDIAKWMEGAAYLIKKQHDPTLEALCDEAIGHILANADENGYFNSYYLTTLQQERFTDRNQHELYCAGHLMEAAIAYADATGKDAFLKLMCRYADYIEKIFMIENSAAFVTPGHPELELALIKLYRATGQARYLRLAKYFIDQHGANEKDKSILSTTNYNQDAKPLRSISTAEGHSVRALYLYCGMIDLAMEIGDQELADACRRCFDNICSRRMYITGGVGSSHLGEAFTVDYHLPNRTAYAETCAAIALAMFASRMQTLEADGRYADTVERAIYNGILSGISLDGKSFFYENPLSVDPTFNHVNVASSTKEHYPITERVEVFDCSCCPPNLVRFLPSVAGLAYSCSEDTLYVHQYMASRICWEGINVSVETAYPTEGAVTVRCRGKSRLALRIPGWCRDFRLNHPYTLYNGYAYIQDPGDSAVELVLDMPAVFLAANPKVHACAGRVAVARGPIIYCAEGVDNPGVDIHAWILDTAKLPQLGENHNFVPNLIVSGHTPVETSQLYYPLSPDRKDTPVTLIPYFSFANRGTTDMLVWLLAR